MTNFASLSSNLPAPIGGGNALATPSGMGGASAAGPKVNPILRYLNAIRRAKWLVALLTLIGLGGGYLLSRLRPPMFEVTGDLLIAPSETPTFLADQWSVFFKSFAVIEPVVVARRLYIKGPKRIGGPPLPLGPTGPYASLFNGFTLSSSYDVGNYRLKVNSDGRSWTMTNVNASKEETGQVGDSVGRHFGFLWLPQIPRNWWGNTFEFQIMTPREAATVLQSDLTVQTLPPRNPRFIHVALRGQESEKTAGTVNDLMATFVDQAARAKNRDVTGAVHGLDSQRVQADAKVRGDYQALLQFQTSTITAPRDVFQVQPGSQATTPGAYGAYVANRNDVDRLKRVRSGLASALTKLKQGQPAADLFGSYITALNANELQSYINELIQDEQKYATLSLRYTDTTVLASTPGSEAVNMPRLRERIRDLRSTVLPARVNSLLEQIDGQIVSGDSISAIQKNELHDIPSRSITELELQRNMDMDQLTLTDITRKYYDAKSREASSVTDVTIQTPGVAPLNPGANKAVLLIVGGAFGGFGAGLALALLLDATDKRLRYADQVTTGLGLTILGVIPEIRRAKGETPSVEEAAQAIEAFRTVRLNLAHALGEGPVLLTISSPSPGDGKSLVSSNLALSFAEAGYRTLLIDGDSRRGELHRTFGVERRPGLLDYLTGEITMDELTRSTTHPQLKIIPGGSRKRNAPELLGTQRMRELLMSMRDKFDVVLVDTPPLGAGIDPFVLGTITGNLMLVLRAGATERDLAEAKLQIVDQLPIRLVGAVLNDVRATMDDYKYYSYSYGYGAVDEPSTSTALTAGKESRES